MPDATLAASYQAYKRCQNRRPDKAFTPHPAISNAHRDSNLPQWFRQHRSIRRLLALVMLPTY
ncbi:hypothetical protein [Escherichia coli]|uniref:hypothetical protein n=1 Tax=Escherichia coli TaxID=562 RepID=UPI0023EDBBF9|nr:hypothetical protein [Escherichia coli]